MLALMLERTAQRVPALGVGSGAVEAELSEDALLARARSGDTDATSRLLRAHAREIAAVCFHVAGPDDAHDATQEALLRIVRELAQFDPARGRFRPWALTVARNVCRDGLRRRGLERAAFDGDGHARSEASASASPDPERLVIARQGATSLARALDDLPAPMREAIVMFHVGEASYEEIASALRVPMGTVMTWLHRGRQRLRAALEEP